MVNETNSLRPLCGRTRSLGSPRPFSIQRLMAAFPWVHPPNDVAFALRSRSLGPEGQTGLQQKGVLVRRDANAAGHG